MGGPGLLWGVGGAVEPKKQKTNKHYGAGLCKPTVFSQFTTESLN